MKTISFNTIHFAAKKGGKHLLKIFVEPFYGLIRKNMHKKYCIGARAFRVLSIKVAVTIELKKTDTAPLSSEAETPTRVASLHSRLDMEDVMQVTGLMNKFQFFRDPVTEGTVAALFDGDSGTRIPARRMMPISRLFEELSRAGLIGRYWQTALSRQGSILLRDGSRAQSRSAYSSALARANQADDRDFNKEIKAMVGRLKEKHDGLKNR